MIQLCSGSFECIIPERFGFINVSHFLSIKPPAAGRSCRGFVLMTKRVMFYRQQGLFKDMVLHLGFTIEGRATDELPESLLACSTLHYPMLERAVEFDV